MSRGDTVGGLAPSQGIADAAKPAPATLAGAAGLRFRLERDLSTPFPVGRGSVFVLRGWCYHPERRVRALELLVDGVAHAASQLGLARKDVLQEEAARDPGGRSLLAGFVFCVPFAEVHAARSVELRLRARVGVHQVEEAAAGTLRLVPGIAEPMPLPPGDTVQGAEPLVGIALATYAPALDLLRIQLESLRAQEHRNWICVINDDASPPATWEAVQSLASHDARFIAHRNDTRLGFYRNFERAIGRLPRSVDYVALCDQDDEWYPDKLSSCLRELDRGATLVYCDMDLVARDGAKLARTYWTTRRNNYTSFETLLFANTVTGAASVFRADLVEDLLPFPEPIGTPFHDHWIACLAMAKGRLGYVDRPLYAYRQHGANVLGHCVPETPRLMSALRTLAGWARLTPSARSHAGSRLRFLEGIYQNEVMRIALLARTLELRLPDMAPARRRVVHRFARLDRSLAGLTAEALKYAISDRPSLGAEWSCLKAALSHRVLQAYHRAARKRVVRRSRGPALAAATERDLAGSVEAIERKIAPLRLDVSISADRRVNLLIPTIDFRYFFGGYIAKFHLALMLQRSGMRVRVVTVDPCDRDEAGWRRSIRAYPGLETFFDDVEVVHAFERSAPLPVNPRDAFVATTWWTAHVAHRAVRDLDQPRFVYLIQEYEPMTFAMGSYFALADETYTYPHEAVFSTELLRDYFRENELGVYRAGAAAGDEHSVSFQNAINSFSVSAAALRREGPRRLLFYARPEAHAQRNMFDLGVLALRRAARRGLLEAWEVHGLGSVGMAGSVVLGPGLALTLLPRTGLKEYLDLLPSYDLGLALMLTPHPSLVPIDMAAAGLVTVTNTFGPKTAERLSKLSGNIIGVPPTLDGLVDGIASAIPRVADVEARVAGSRVRWATRWEDAFDDSFRTRLAAFLDRNRPGSS